MDWRCASPRDTADVVAKFRYQRRVARDQVLTASALPNNAVLKRYNTPTAQSTNFSSTRPSSDLICLRCSRLYYAPSELESIFDDDEFDEGVSRFAAEGEG
jgi:hypothetical protein